MSGPRTPSRPLRLASAAIAIAAAVVLLVAAAEEPVFLRWLDPANPGDATILVYWHRVQSGEAGPVETVDLGTMLFHRGFPNDAARLYRQALDRDPSIAEGWLNLGLVEHEQDHRRAAERAYRRCLKLSPRQPWCNFYLGRLLEQTGRPSEALEHYREAFAAAPELADPTQNPEVQSSAVALGARIEAAAPRQFVDTAPLPFTQPQAVGKTLAGFLPEPTPSPTPAPTPPPPATVSGGAASTDLSPPSTTTSPQVSTESHGPQSRPPSAGGEATAPGRRSAPPQPVPPEVISASGTGVFQPR